MEKFQVPRFVIWHAHPAKLFWDLFILLCILYTVTVVPFIVCFEYQDSIVRWFDTFVDTMFIIDIVLTLFTSYLDEDGNVVVDRSKIRRHYFKGWFVVDIFASFPYSLLAFVDAGNKVWRLFGCWFFLLTQFIFCLNNDPFPQFQLYISWKHQKAKGKTKDFLVFSRGKKW